MIARNFLCVCLYAALLSIISCGRDDTAPTTTTSKIPCDAVAAERIYDAAHVLYDSSLYDTAYVELVKASAALRCADLPPNSLDNSILQLQSNIYYEQKKYDLSLLFLDSASHWMEEYGYADDAMRGINLRYRGNIFSDKNDYIKAKNTLFQAKKMIEGQLGAHDETALVLKDIGTCYTSLRNRDSARYWLQQAVDMRLAVNGKTDYQLASIYSAIGVSHYQEGEFPKAIEQFEKVMPLYEHKFGPNHRKTAMVYYNLGVNWMKMGNHVKSKAYFEQALHSFKKTFGDNHARVAMVYNSLGLYEAEHTQNGKQAMAYFDEAMRINLKTYGPDHPQTAKGWNSKGIAYRQLGENEKSYDAHQKCHEILVKKLGAKHPLVQIPLSGLARAAKGLGRSEEAAAILKATYQKQKDKYGLGHFDVQNTGLTLAEYYLLAENTALATQILDELATEMKDSTSFRYAVSLGIRAEIDELQADLEKAIQTLNRAIRLHRGFIQKQQISPTDKMVNYSLLNRLLAQRARVEKAVYDAKSLSSLENSLRDWKEVFGLHDVQRNSYSEIESAKILGETLHKQANTAIETALLLNAETNEPSYLADALGFAERTKSYQLLKGMRSNAAVSTLPPALADSYSDLGSKVHFYQKKLLKLEAQKKDAEMISKAKAELFDLKTDYTALLDKIEKEHPQFYQLNQQQEHFDLEKFKEKLPEDLTCIQYFSTKDAVVAFVIDKNNTTSHRFEVDLGEDVQALNEAMINCHLNGRNRGVMYDSCAAKYSTTAYELYQKILEPLDIKSEKLLIVADGLLNYVPFEALLTEKAINPSQFAALSYLMKQKEIFYAPSLSWWEEVCARETTGEGLLAFAPIFKDDNTEFLTLSELRGEGLGVLQHNTGEANAVTQRLSGKTFIGANATLQNLMDKAKDCSVLHLATHAKANDETPSLSWLAFPPNSDSTEAEKLLMHDVYNMHIPADMVVLSACETGFGKLQNGEGVLSFAHAFSFAGAKSLITSLWSVNDQSTATIMDSFYKNLSEKKSKSDALRQAKLDYIFQSDHADAHPFYWAAFVPMGDMAPLTIQSNNWFVTILLGLVGFLFLWLVFRRKT